MADVRLATLADRTVLADIAAAGFHDDPVLSWALRDAARRLDQLRVVFGGLAEDMLPDRGTVHLAADASAAFWRPPDFEHHRSARDRLEDAAGEDDGTAGPFAPDELERFEILGGLMLEHHPHEPHWYLNVVSTIPERQGQGLGATVLRPVLDRCDADGVPAYLESTNPRNRTLYLRQGFVPMGEVVLPDGPALLQMWREPQR
jgi:GNAT superfamily N-acetyltransferase